MWPTVASDCAGAEESSVAVSSDGICVKGCWASVESVLFLLCLLLGAFASGLVLPKGYLAASDRGGERSYAFWVASSKGAGGSKTLISASDRGVWWVDAFWSAFDSR